MVLHLPKQHGESWLDVLDHVDDHDLSAELELELGPVLDGAKIDAVREALRGLSEGIRARRELVRREEESDFDWMGLVDDLRHRLSTFGVTERSAAIDEFGMDEVALARARGLHDFLQHRYWRIEVAGRENLPTEWPCLFVANRSGLLPYDGMMLAHILEQLHESHDRPRFLVADWLITLPFMQPTLARLGGVRACRENADRLLRTGRSVIAFPEGVKGAAKVFGERYQLKRFGRGGVVRAALEGGVPLVPVGLVGPEEAHPILFKSHTLARPVGLPFIPVTPTFPWLGPLGLLPLPAKWVVNFGEPIHLDVDPKQAASDELLVSRLTEQLRSSVQGLVSEALDLRESVFSR